MLVGLGSRGGNDSDGRGTSAGVPVELGLRGGSDKDDSGMSVEVPVGLGSRGGSDRDDNRVPVGLGLRGGNDKDDSGVSAGLPVELGLRGGNDRPSGSKTGCGVIVGSDGAGVLELYPSSRLKTRPLARAAKAREEMITLDNMISREK